MLKILLVDISILHPLHVWFRNIALAIVLKTFVQVTIKQGFEGLNNSKNDLSVSK